MPGTRERASIGFNRIAGVPATIARIMLEKIKDLFFRH
jgi:hypothetical protein